MIHPIVSPSLPDTSDSETLMSLAQCGGKTDLHVTGILNLVTGVMVQTAFALLKELS